MRLVFLFSERNLRFRHRYRTRTREFTANGNLKISWKKLLEKVVAIHEWKVIDEGARPPIFAPLFKTIQPRHSG